MIYVIILVLFIIYSIAIFFVNNLFVLAALFLINLVFLGVIKKDLKKLTVLLKNNVIFITFVFICNLIFMNLEIAFLTSFKLFAVLISTYVINELFTPIKFGQAIYNLLYPLKIFKINIKDISLIITIAITFIPVLTDEAKNIKKALIIKGMKFTIKNCLLNPHIYLITYLSSIFKRIDEIEKSLLMKAYE